ncbi:unnamed protein product, partial [Ixodes pacificus]
GRVWITSLPRRHRGSSLLIVSQIILQPQDLPRTDADAVDLCARIGKAGLCAGLCATVSASGFRVDSAVFAISFFFSRILFLSFLAFPAKKCMK